VIGIVSGTASEASRELGPEIGVSVTGAMMVLMIAYTAYKARERPPPHWSKYGPLYCIILAAMFILADPVRHILTDNALWSEGAMYRPGCENEDMSCLSFVGGLFEASTYIGFTLLVIGTLWNAHIMQKLKLIRRKWKILREGTAPRNVIQVAPSSAATV